MKAAERGDESGRSDGEVDDHRQPAAHIAGGERVERRRVLRPERRVVDAEAERHHPGDEDVEDERDEHRGQDRLRNRPKRVRRLLAEDGGGLEADEAGEREHDGEEEIARRGRVGRIERREREARVAALEQDHDRQHRDRADADRRSDQLDPGRDADVEEGDQRERAEEDEEPRVPAPVDARMRAHRDRHEERADHEHEGDPDGEAAAVEPAAEEARARAQAARDVGVEAAGARHPPREADDHRGETEAADAGDQVRERGGDARLPGGCQTMRMQRRAPATTAPPTRRERRRCRGCRAGAHRRPDRCSMLLTSIREKGEDPSRGAVGAGDLHRRDDDRRPLGEPVEVRDVFEDHPAGTEPDPVEVERRRIDRIGARPVETDRRYLARRSAPSPRRHRDTTSRSSTRRFRSCGRCRSRTARRRRPAPCRAPARARRAESARGACVARRRSSTPRSQAVPGRSHRAYRRLRSGAPARRHVSRCGSTSSSASSRTRPGQPSLLPRTQGREARGKRACRSHRHGSGRRPPPGQHRMSEAREANRPGSRFEVQSASSSP